MDSDQRTLPPRSDPWTVETGRTPKSTAGLPNASLVLGIIAMLANVLLVPTVLAIVLGSIALGRGTTMQTRSIVGVVLGGAGVFAAGFQIAVLIPLIALVVHVAG